MKVLQIETIYSSGGISGIVLSLMDALNANGDDCRFAYGRERIAVPPERQNSVFRMEGKAEVYFHVAKSKLFDRSGFGSTAATKRLISYIDQYKPDLIQLHSLLGYYVNVRVLFEYLVEYGRPVVWTQHDCWAFTGHCIHFVTADCDKWKTGCSKCPLIHTYPESLLADNSAKNYKEKKRLFTSVKNMTLVTPSEWLAGFVRQSFLADYPIRVIPNGIDLGVYRPTESDYRKRYGLGSKKVILGVAGVWAPSKGLDFLTQAYKMLDSEKYALVIIGADNEQRDLMPDGAIAFRRTSDVSDLVKWYSLAYAFVNPTLADNFPTVNLEALACGTPVITFRTGGSPESIDESCGIVTKEKTAEAIVKAIEELSKKNITAESCMKRAKMYDRNRCFGEYVKLYHELTDK